MSPGTESDALLRDLVQDGGPLLETLAQMNTDSLSQTCIDEQAAMLVRLAHSWRSMAWSRRTWSTWSWPTRSGHTETVRAAVVTFAPLVGSADRGRLRTQAGLSNRGTDVLGGGMVRRGQSPVPPSCTWGNGTT
jgi:hypothetical protein